MRTTNQSSNERLRARSEPSVGGQALRFAAIGVVSTLAYAALFMVVRGLTTATLANALALVVTALGNTAANRRLTFGVRGPDSLVRDHLAGLTALGVAVLITSLAVALLELIAPDAGRVVELAVLIVANVPATVARFVLLRAWVARDRRPSTAPIQFERTAS